MRELRFDGLSPEGDRLVLAGKDGQKYTVVIDERLEAAVRRDRARMSQVEIEQAGVLRPREIQARIRSGATAEDVAAASGLSIEHVRRFEGPVLTERAWVAQQAQATEVRRPGGDIELGDLVAERLAGQGVDPADIAWDAWRRDDGRWVVIATFPIPPNTHVATWTYDSASRTMTVADDNAGSLSAITPEEPLRLAVARPMLSTVAALDVEDSDDEPYGPATILSRRYHQESAVPERDEDEQAEEVDDELGDGPEPEHSGAESEDDDNVIAGGFPVHGSGTDESRESGSGAAGDWAGEGDEGAEAVDAGPADLPDPDGLTDFPVDEGIDPDADDEPGDHRPADEGPDDEDSGDDEDSDDDEDSGDDEDEATRPETDALTSGPTLDAEDVPLFETPPAAPHRPTGKPPVPSFDDILFGPGPSK